MSVTGGRLVCETRYGVMRSKIARCAPDTGPPLKRSSPVRSGSQLEHVGRWLGMRILSRAVVTVFEPPTAFGYDITTSMSSTPSRMRYLLAREGECTKLTLSNEAKLPALMAPLASLLQRSVQAMFNRDVRRLRDTLEAGG